jgi:transcription termination/antitermination protein NusG
MCRSNHYARRSVLGKVSLSLQLLCNITVWQEVKVSGRDSSRESVPTSNHGPHWYAAHIRSRHEKRVAEQLAGKNVNVFLPLYTAEHRWNDRLARVELPLFPGYMFVQIALRDRLKVLEVPGVVRLVSSGGEPVSLEESEINTLRQGLTSRLKAEPHPYLKIGNRVKIKSGALAGLEGILLRKKDSYRVVISVDLIMRSIAVEISAADVEAP